MTIKQGNLGSKLTIKFFPYEKGCVPEFYHCEMWYTDVWKEYGRC